MKDHVAHHDRVICPRGEMFEVGLVPSAVGGPAGRHGPAIESVDPRTTTRKFPGEFAEPGAEFEDGLAGLNEGRERTEEPPPVAHESVDQPEVTAVVEGIGVVVRERVEQFWGEAAFHEEKVEREEMVVKRSGHWGARR